MTLDPRPMTGERRLRLEVAQAAEDAASKRNGKSAHKGDLPAGVDPLSDLANAHRLEARHGTDLRYSRSLGWLAYDGKRFAPDATGEAERRAHAVARDLLREAGELMSFASVAGEDERKRLEEKAKTLMGWSRKSQQAPRIAAALQVAGTLASIAVTSEVFDADPFLLNAANGTLDLRTGALHAHRRDDLLTKLSAVGFDADATCPEWLAFLARIFGGDNELVGFVQRAIGYSLTGDTREQCFFVCYGTGANGKSTMLEAVRHVVGDYGLTSATDTFMRARDGRGAENDVARLRGARFVAAVESGEERRLDEERIKRLTGGDTIAARFLYREHFEFRPEFKIWLAVNDKPEIAGVDLGIWRRVRLIPFGVTIPAHEQDRELAAKLRAEAPGILAWAVQGALAWHQAGLQAPAVVTDATKQWRGEANPVARFVDEACAQADGLSVKAGALYATFAEWSKHAGEEPMNAKRFGMRLTALGFKPDRTNAQGRIWRGLTLRGEEHVA